MTTAAVHNGTVAGFHGRAAVALIGTDGTRTAVRPSKSVCAGLPLQFTKNHIFVSKEVSDQAVAVTLVHGKTALPARPEYALRQ